MMKILYVDIDMTSKHKIYYLLVQAVVLNKEENIEEYGEQAQTQLSRVRQDGKPVI